MDSGGLSTKLSATFLHNAEFALKSVLAAQNAGATHVWVEDLSIIRQIEDTLEIKPWQPE